MKVAISIIQFHLTASKKENRNKKKKKKKKKHRINDSFLPTETFSLISRRLFYTMHFYFIFTVHFHSTHTHTQTHTLRWLSPVKIATTRENKFLNNIIIVSCIHTVNIRMYRWCCILYIFFAYEALCHTINIYGEWRSSQWKHTNESQKWAALPVPVQMWMCQRIGHKIKIHKYIHI